MKETISTLVIALTTIIFCHAQKIEVEKVFGGYRYTQNGHRMTMGALVKTIKPNPQAFDLIKKAQSNNAFASLMGVVGGGLVGWPLGTALGGGDPNWTLLGIGAGLIAVGAPISSSANKKANQAVELYNASLNSTSFYEFKPEFNVMVKGSGIGVSMKF